MLFDKTNRELSAAEDVLSSLKRELSYATDTSAVQRSISDQNKIIAQLKEKKLEHSQNMGAAMTREDLIYGYKNALKSFNFISQQLSEAIVKAEQTDNYSKVASLTETLEKMETSLDEATNALQEAGISLSEAQEA